MATIAEQEHVDVPPFCEVEIASQETPPETVRGTRRVSRLDTVRIFCLLCLLNNVCMTSKLFDQSRLSLDARNSPVEQQWDSFEPFQESPIQFECEYTVCNSNCVTELIVFCKLSSNWNRA
jgi:hypothetical protein